MMKHLTSDATETKIKHYYDNPDFYEGDVQPNAIDVRVLGIKQITSGLFVLSNEGKKPRGTRDLKLYERPDGLWWRLNEGSYEVLLDGDITIGKTEAGIIVPRSTLIRNGVYLHSGLYDSGYHGPMVASLQVTEGLFDLKYHTRIGQMLIFEAEALNQYNGSYQVSKTEVHEASNSVVEVSVDADAPVVKRGRGRPRKNPQ
jgi:dUTP pyrophosphatase